jgi:PAS domain S-box-containing protein
MKLTEKAPGTNTRVNNSNPEIQTVVAIFGCAFGTVLGLGFGIATWIDGNLLIATADFAMTLLFVVLGVWTIWRRSQTVSVALLAVAACSFFFFLFITGGAYSTGIMWSILIPPFAFSLLSVRNGALLSIGYLFLITAAFVLDHTSVTDLSMPSEEVFIRFIAIFFVIGGILAAYEATRVRNEAELLRRMTDQRELESDLHKLKRAVDQSSSVILITDMQGTIEYANSSIEESTGYPREEVIGNNPRMFNSGETDPAVYVELWNAISTGRDWSGELRNKRKDGSLFWEASSISPIRDDNGNVTHYLAVKEDVTWRKAADERLAEMYRETQRMNEVMSGREDRIIELKKEVNALSRKLAQNLVYPSVEEDS